MIQAADASFVRIVDQPLPARNNVTASQYIADLLNYYSGKINNETARIHSLEFKLFALK